MTMKDILDNFINEKESLNILTEEERFKEIYSKNVAGEVYEYLISHFNNLKIEILGDYKGNLIYLMER